MSADQVRWRINYLTKKYKECIDNYSKSGRSTITLDFFNEMEQIFGYEKNASATYTLSSDLPSKKITDSALLTKTSKDSALPVKNSRDSALPSKKSNDSFSGTQVNKLKREHTGYPIASTSTDANNEAKNSEQNKVLHKKSSTQKQLKTELEKVCLEYMDVESKRRENHNENMLKTKNESLKLKKQYLEMREKEVEVKKAIAANKIKAKERRHEELIEIEKLKYELLKDLINKENLRIESDSD